MGKAYITVENGRVQLIHNMPFDQTYGLGKSEAELRSTGVLLDSIPDPERIDGKIAVAMYNEEKGFYYEYENANNGENNAVYKALKAGIITQEQYDIMTDSSVTR